MDLSEVKWTMMGRDYPRVDCYGLLRCLNEDKNLPRHDDLGNIEVGHDRTRHIEELERVIETYLEVCPPEQSDVIITLYNRGFYFQRPNHILIKYNDMFIDIQPNTLRLLDLNSIINYYKFLKFYKWRVS